MSGKPLQRLKVSANNRFLVREDGTPFFWLGDTAWELFHKLNRDDAAHYLRTRAEQGFTVVQAVALAEFEGVTTDNAHGRRPLRTNASGAVDPTLPDVEGPYSYWDHVDWVLSEAASLGLYIALLPTWGDKFNKLWGKGPEIFTPENAFAYSRWLGERYRDAENVIWVLGGDRPLQTRRHFEIVDAMARGLKAGDGGSRLMTFHPQGAQSSSHHVHDEEWLDFNMIQSGHGEAQITNYKRVLADYERQPIKPTLDGEPCYEDIPVGFRTENGYFDEADVRRAAYYAVLSGALGHTYGHHSVWSMMDGPGGGEGHTYLMSWKQALRRPGAEQMRHVRSLAEARGFGRLAPDPEMVAHNDAGNNYIAAARADDHAYVYTPNGAPIAAKLGRLPGGRLTASWFDPRTGGTESIGEIENEGVRRFAPPSAGRGSDWVLVLEAGPCSGS